MAQTLSSKEVKKRLIKLRNLEQLHEAQRFKIWGLRDENRKLRKEIVELRITASEHQKTINDLKLQVEELRTIVFGKKRKKGESRYNDFPPQPAVSRESRPKESYRRKVPLDDAVTEVRSHSIHACPQCRGNLSECESKTYYEEDIPIPQKKIVIKHAIKRGYCSACKRWRSSIPLPSAPVILGENVKRYIAYLSVVCRQSYSQIEDILKQFYDFYISQGEIANVMRDEGERMRPEYERLKASIRGEPSVHLDETGWNILTNGGDRGFAWTMTGGVSKDMVFTLGKTRGKGNANELIYDSKAVVVSDDYAGYRNIKNPHQLCLAHILRKLRDLARSGEIAEYVRVHCQSAYETFAGIYADLETARKSSNPPLFHNEFLNRLRTFAAHHASDPAKLLRVKTQVSARAEKYLTCLKYPNVTSDNNAAERSLRHLVLKRKISFGSLTERTAETMAILLSVLMSRKRRGELRNYLMGV